MFILESKGQRGGTCVGLFYCEYSKGRTILGGGGGWPLVTRTLQRDLGNCESQGVGVGGGCRWDLSDIENEDRQLGGGGTVQKPDKIY